MKRNILRRLAAVLLLCPGALPSAAQERSKEELRLESSAGELDKHYSEGQDRVADMIKAQFGVDDGRLLGLRYRKLKYGEIAIALGLAQEMRGGITDKNLHRIIALRQGPPVAGWGEVAGKFKLKLEAVQSKINRLLGAVKRDEVSDKAREAGEKTTEMKAAADKDGSSGTVPPAKPEKDGMFSLMRK